MAAGRSTHPENAAPSPDCRLQAAGQVWAPGRQALHGQCPKPSPAHSWGWASCLLSPEFCPV